MKGLPPSEAAYRRNRDLDSSRLKPLAKWFGIPNHMQREKGVLLKQTPGGDKVRLLGLGLKRWLICKENTKGCSAKVLKQTNPGW